MVGPILSKLVYIGHNIYNRCYNFNDYVQNQFKSLVKRGYYDEINSIRADHNKHKIKLH